DETAAICVEPIIGEGGIKANTHDYLRALRQVADEFEILLYFDEIQCGFGRTGKLFAHEWADITPDVMCIAKGAGGGFPMGACLATEEAAVGMTASTHGSTFGGNPLAMAVGNAVLDVMLEVGFFQKVCSVADRFAAGLEKLVADHPRLFAEARGVGLMRGLVCEPPVGDVVGALREAGLLAVPAGENVVRLLPPLIVEEAEIDEALAILRSVAEGWKSDEH
ncbi:MAG: aminotransferase class III-fold pyridoxal phosphate-dependent enzyme, partial [Pseudomonadota bacterium]